MPTTWYIARDGKQHGPITDLEFRKLVELGHLKGTDYVWHDGAADWLPGTQFLDLPPAAAKPEPAPPAGDSRKTPESQPTGNRAEPQPAADRPAPSGGRRIVVAAVSVAVAVLVGVLGKLAVDGVLDSGLFRPAVDRAAVEKQLLADPKMRWLQILQEKQPKSYGEFMDALMLRLERRERREDSIDYLRKSFVEPIFSANAPHLDDEAVARYTALIADQMEAFAQKNPILCVRLLRGQPLGDVRQYLPEALQARELQILEEALLVDKTKPRRWYTQAEQTKLMQIVVTKLAGKHGDLVRLIDPATPADGRERDACTIGTALFREIAALPGPNSAALMRSLLAAPK